MCGGNKPVAINSAELDWTCTSNLEKEIVLVLSGSVETPPTEAFRQEIELQTLHDLSKFSYTDPTLGTGHFCELLIEAVALDTLTLSGVSLRGHHIFSCWPGCVDHKQEEKWIYSCWGHSSSIKKSRKLSLCGGKKGRAGESFFYLLSLLKN